MKGRALTPCAPVTLGEVSICGAFRSLLRRSRRARATFLALGCFGLHVGEEALFEFCDLPSPFCICAAIFGEVSVCEASRSLRRRARRARPTFLRLRELVAI